MRGDPWTFALAGIFALLAAAALGLWIPSDIETGIVETFRRQTTIGDALAPAGAASGMLLAALALAVAAFFRPAGNSASGLDRTSLLFIVRMTLVLGVAIMAMFHAGPLTVDAINAVGGDIGSYRQLRDTIPYKYLGYLIGGIIMVGGMTAVIEQRISRGILATAVFATAGLALFYDVPFDDLLLPPNGDQ